MPVKFGIQIEPQLGYDYDTILSIAQHVESIGFDSIWASDHFFLDKDSHRRDCLDVWTLLTGLAVQTDKLLLGPLVSCNSYRHPAVLAKVAASIDMMSEGRLIFGYGAGWKQVEYAAYGIPFPKVQTRMDQMEEAVQIIKLLWTEPSPTFEGEHYQIKDAISSPKPVQEPHPPFLIGGGGEKRTLLAVAKYADMSNLGSRDFHHAEHKLDVLRNHCDNVGRNYDSIEKTFYGSAYVAENKEELATYIEKRSKVFGISVDEYKKRINTGAGSFVGLAEDVIERYQYLIDLGFTHFQVFFPYQNEIDMSTRFHRLVRRELEI